MTDDDATEPDAPAFFLSYARARQPHPSVGTPMDFNDPVLKLYRDLSIQINQLISMPVGLDQGFIDIRTETGARWEPELVRKVSTCTVFVALLSDPYLASVWCRREWNLFARRTVRLKPGRTGGARPAAMLPVVWGPTDRDYPDEIAAVERFAPIDLPQEYRAEYDVDGLLGASNVHKDAYRAIVFKIARRIQHVRDSYIVDPPGPDDLRELPDKSWEAAS